MEKYTVWVDKRISFSQRCATKMRTLISNYLLMDDIYDTITIVILDVNDFFFETKILIFSYSMLTENLKAL